MIVTRGMAQLLNHAILNNGVKSDDRVTNYSANEDMQRGYQFALLLTMDVNGLVELAADCETYKATDAGIAAVAAYVSWA